MDAYEATLRDLYGLAHRGIRPGLERVHDALARIGDPHRALRAVHVAGTNGKGSTSAMIAHGLAAAGHRVGLYTSPHLATLLERVQVFGAPPIERADIVEGWARLRAALEAPGAPPLTFFEALTVLALDRFAARGLDAVVLETGLGGRLDATNVIEAPLACAITRVGIDHERFLGGTITEIAKEKAGILKAGAPASIAVQHEAARSAIEECAAALAPAPQLTWVGVDVPFERREDGTISVHCGHRSIDGARPALAGAHQAENAATAASVLWTLEDRGLRVDVRAAIEAVRWPGRLEWIGAMLFDAAHNEDGARTLASYLAARPRARRVLLFGAMNDKAWRAMLEVLRPQLDAIVFTAPSEMSRAEAPAALAAAVSGEIEAAVVADVEEAIERARAMAGQGGEVVVAGSMYLMGEVRSRVLGVPRDPPIAM